MFRNKCRSNGPRQQLIDEDLNVQVHLPFVLKQFPGVRKFIEGKRKASIKTPVIVSRQSHPLADIVRHRRHCCSPQRRGAFTDPSREVHYFLTVSTDTRYERRKESRSSLAIISSTFAPQSQSEIGSSRGRLFRMVPAASQPASRRRRKRHSPRKFKP